MIWLNYRRLAQNYSCLATLNLATCQSVGTVSPPQWCLDSLVIGRFQDGYGSLPSPPIVVGQLSGSHWTLTLWRRRHVTPMVNAAG